MIIVVTQCLLFVVSRWHDNYDILLTCWCRQAWWNMRCGSDWTMYTEVKTTFFMTNNTLSWHVQWKLTISTRWHHQSLKAHLTPLEADLVNPIEVHQSMKRHFLLPVGGAITVTQYWHVYFLRPGLLSSMTNFGQIWQSVHKVKQLPVLWWNMQNGCHSTATLYIDTFRDLYQT